VRPTIDSRLQLAAIVLAEELHYGRAAQKLHIAVSTLSKQIALLEEKLGIILFVRNSKVVELTEAGRAYVEEARASLFHAEKAINVARAANDGLEHILTAGHTPYTDPMLVLMLLSIHLPLYPNIRVQLHSDFAFDLVHGLLTAELDVALIAWPPEGAALTLVEIAQAPLYVALPEWHPASGLERVTVLFEIPFRRAGDLRGSLYLNAHLVSPFRPYTIARIAIAIIPRPPPPPPPPLPNKLCVMAGILKRM
jgi:DNA-binding transcriptional LysR family regulator